MIKRDGVNLWQELQRYDDYNLLEEFGREYVKITDFGEIRLKKLLNRKWHSDGSEEYLDWHCGNSYCSSQTDVMRVVNAVAFVRKQKIKIVHIDFETRNNACDINRFCCYEIKLY